MRNGKVVRTLTLNMHLWARRHKADFAEDELKFRLEEKQNQARKRSLRVRKGGSGGYHHETATFDAPDM